MALLMDLRMSVLAAIDEWFSRCVLAVRLYDRGRLRSRRPPSLEFFGRHVGIFGLKNYA